MVRHLLVFPDDLSLLRYHKRLYARRDDMGAHPTKTEVQRVYIPNLMMELRALRDARRLMQRSCQEPVNSKASCQLRDPALVRDRPSSSVFCATVYKEVGGGPMQSMKFPLNARFRHN